MARRALRPAGKLLDFGIEQEVPIRGLLHELLERVEPVLDRLNCREEVSHVHTIMQRGASSDQQRHVWRQNGEDGKAVVDFLVFADGAKPMIERPKLTLGIEEEYQVIDPESGELRSFITPVHRRWQEL